jgi:hypothetical protein
MRKKKKKRKGIGRSKCFYAARRLETLGGIWKSRALWNCAESAVNQRRRFDWREAR